MDNIESRFEGGVTRNLTRALSIFMEGCIYTEWSDETARSNAKSASTYLKNSFDHVHFAECSTEELQLFGFREFTIVSRNENDGKTLMLIPLYLIECIPENTEVCSIFGEKCKLKHANNDVRLGCIAYGFLTKEK